MAIKKRSIKTKRNKCIRTFVSKIFLPIEVFKCGLFLDIRVFTRFCTYFYIQKLLRTKAFTHKVFTHKRLYTYRLVHTDNFTQRFLHKQTLTYTYTFLNRRRLYTQTLFYILTLSHTDTFAHRSFYTETLFLHRCPYTQPFLPTEAFTNRFLRTDAFTQRYFYTQELFTHKSIYTQTDSFTYYIQKLLHMDTYFVRKGCSGASQIAFSHQFLPIDPHFVRKGCSGPGKIVFSPQFLSIDHYFVRKGCSGTSKIAIFP